MPRYESRIAVTGEDFATNSRAYEQHLQLYRENLEKISPALRQNAVTRHTERGKLFARDRISGLLDAGSPFFELGQFAGFELYPGEDIPGGGAIAGLGFVHGRMVAVMANDATVKGGTAGGLSLFTICRRRKFFLERIGHAVLYGAGERSH